ncbi:MAG: HlyD family efflux transporter periplasmic adaptor subunit [Rhodospirillaceae bacterium]
MTPLLKSLPLATVAIVVLSLLSACDSQDVSGSYTGYVEADYIYVSAPAAGWLEDNDLREGEDVEQGRIMFTLEQGLEVAALAEAKSRYDQAAALERDLETGARDAELEVLRSELQEAQASLTLARAERKRWTQLAEQGVAPLSRRDQVVADEEKAQARVQSLKQNIDVARLAGRDAARDAAIAAREAAAAAMTQAEWRLSQRSVTAGVAGRVEEIFHRPGEYVTSGAPVVALLPPDGLKLRFFVPQADLNLVAPGQMIEVSSDGLPNRVTAHIRFIATEAEFTPPVIYSVGVREKLMFLVEGTFDSRVTLRPGQPVDVHLP